MRVWCIKKMEALWESMQKSTKDCQKNPRKLFGKKFGNFFAQRKSSQLLRLTSFKTIEEWGRQFYFYR